MTQKASKSTIHRFAVTISFLDYPMADIISGKIEPPTIEYIQQQMQEIVDKADELKIKAGVMQGEEGQGKAPEDYLDNDEISAEDKQAMLNAKFKHIQAYFQTEGKTRRKTLNNRAKKAGLRQNWHVEDARGSTNKNIEYCTKGTGDYTYASGAVKFSEQLTEPVWINKDKIVKIKGQRTDLKTIYEEMEAGDTPQDIRRKYPATYMRYRNNIWATYAEIQEDKNAQSRPDKMECFLLWGDKGTGKSSDVLDKYAKQFGYERKDVYILHAGNYGNVWFNGYKGQKILLIDEYDPNAMPRSILLSIMNDNYRFSGEVKGQDRVLSNWDYVFITTNYTPQEICRKKVKVQIEDDWGNVREVTSWEYDEAMASRMLEICYNGMPDKRKKAKKYKPVNAKDLTTTLPQYLADCRDVPSDASLLPASLEHGTSLMLNGTMRECEGATLTQLPLEQFDEENGTKLEVI